MTDLIEAAIADGRIPPSQADHYRRLLDNDKAQGEAIIAALAPTRRPRHERLHTPRIEEATYPQSWLPDVGEASTGPVTLESPELGGAALAGNPSHGRVGRPIHSGYGAGNQPVEQGDYGEIGRSRQ